jgi:hypothetical protein
VTRGAVAGAAEGRPRSSPIFSTVAQFRVVAPTPNAFSTSAFG